MSHPETASDTGRPLPLGAWVRRYTSTVNEDVQLRAHGRHYSCSFLMDMQECAFVVHMHHGQVERISVAPGPLDERYQFLLRASAITWTRMAAPVPQPMYHGIFAAQAQHDLVIEGDLLVLMQHLRCFVRQFELLRVVGVPAEVAGVPGATASVGPEAEGRWWRG